MWLDGEEQVDTFVFPVVSWMWGNARVLERRHGDLSKLDSSRPGCLFSDKSSKYVLLHCSAGVCNTVKLNLHTHIVCFFFYGPRDARTYLLFFLLSRSLFFPVTGTTGHINFLWSIQVRTVLPVSPSLFSTCQLSPGQPGECCDSLPSIG